MLDMILNGLLWISLGMIFLGLGEFFTSKWNEKWYFGMDWGFKFLTDKQAGKLVYAGLILLCVTFVLIVFLKS
jgi:hypothetical protein